MSGIRSSSDDEPFFSELVQTGQYKLLLMGETGAGKTSFLNLFCNCAMAEVRGYSFDEKGFTHFRPYNDKENEPSRAMASKTTHAKLHRVDLGELSIGVIDTPGFADSRGMEQDKKNVKSIVRALNGEEFVNCVCLVINGRLANLSANLRYVLTGITSILPKQILNNVIVVFTNTDRRRQLNFDPNELEDFFGKKLEHLFFVENPYCMFERVVQSLADLDEDDRSDLTEMFEKTQKVLRQMCVVMKKFDRVYTDLFYALFKKKEKVEREVLKLLLAYDFQRELEKKIKKVEEEVEAAILTKSLNKDFKTEQEIRRWVTIKTDRHNTLCGYPGCYSNCHVSCHLPKSMDKNTFKKCRSMERKDNCARCTHHYTHHYHNEIIFKEGVAIKQFLQENMKRKFEEAETMEQRKRIICHQLCAEYEQSEKERKKLSEGLLRNIEEFQTLGVNRNYEKLIESQYEVIKLRLEGTTGEETKYLRETLAKLEKKLKILKAIKN